MGALESAFVECHQLMFWGPRLRIAGLLHAGQMFTAASEDQVFQEVDGPGLQKDAAQGSHALGLGVGNSPSFRNRLL